MEFNELKGESLNLHEALEREVDLISGRTILYSSVSPIEEKGDVEFYIPPDPRVSFLVKSKPTGGLFRDQSR